MYRIESELHPVALQALRPTQMTVGFREVEEKKKTFSKLGTKKRNAAISELFFPAVIGPGQAYFILDHHHSAVALLEHAVKKVQVGVVKDLSSLDETSFWIYLDHNSWVHPYDHLGTRRPLGDLPTHLSELADDPYRSLAGAVRDRGGFAKSDAPFLEFLWTNYFRSQFKPALLKSHFRRTVKDALKLAGSEKTKYLPGWCGKS